MNKMFCKNKHKSNQKKKEYGFKWQSEDSW